MVLALSNSITLIGIIFEVCGFILLIPQIKEPIIRNILVGFISQKSVFKIIELVFLYLGIQYKKPNISIEEYETLAKDNPKIKKWKEVNDMEHGIRQAINKKFNENDGEKIINFVASVTKSNFEEYQYWKKYFDEQMENFILYKYSDLYFTYIRYHLAKKKFQQVILFGISLVIFGLMCQGISLFLK